MKTKKGSPERPTSTKEESPKKVVIKSIRGGTKTSIRAGDVVVEKLGSDIWQRKS